MQNNHTDLRALVERVRNNLEAHRNELPDEWQDFIAEQVRDLNAAMQAALDAQAGLVMVPRVPTEAMRQAFLSLDYSDLVDFNYYGGMTGWDMTVNPDGAEIAWTAMLAAAPAGPVEAQASLECVGWEWNDTRDDWEWMPLNFAPDEVPPARPSIQYRRIYAGPVEGGKP